MTYQIIATDRLFHFLSDDEAIAVFDWCSRQLAPGGLMIFFNLAAGSSDRIFLECVLDWAPERREEDELRRLIAESDFRDASVSIEALAGGAVQKLVIRKEPVS